MDDVSARLPQGGPTEAAGWPNAATQECRSPRSDNSFAGDRARCDAHGNFHGLGADYARDESDDDAGGGAAGAAANEAARESTIDAISDNFDVEPGRGCARCAERMRRVRARSAEVLFCRSVGAVLQRPPGSTRRAC